MEKKMYTFFDLIVDVFKNSKIPMSVDEIWEKAVEMNLDKKLRSNGKTPSQTVGAKLYTDIKENRESSIFVQVSKRPARFFLKELYQKNPQQTISEIEKIEKKETNKDQKSDFNERDLHPLLVKYVKENPHFGCYTKTIFHEKSKRKQKGENQWLHPDLVGVHFSFDDYTKETTGLRTCMKATLIKLFSFEMKKHLSYTNLREYFFQAVSNSSWANEGYLVCLNMDEDPDFKNELQRLSNAFGIGIIKLNAEDINNSEIVCPARFNENIDWETLNRLAEESKGFRTFLSDLQEDLRLEKVKSTYDKVYSDEDYEKYLIDKKIPLRNR